MDEQTGSKAVVEAVHQLLDGSSKDNCGSLMRHFDERDAMFERLQVMDLLDTSEFKDDSTTITADTT
jgi:hypothetical protein